MPDNLSQITKEIIASIKAKLDEVDELLPEVPVLSPAALRKLQQVKGRRLPFIIRGLTGAKDNPQAVQPKINVPQWEAVQTDYLGLDELEAELMKRLTAVRLLKAIKGDEAYANTRKFYRFLRDNIADYGNLKPLLDELGASFEGQGDDAEDEPAEPPAK